MNKRDIAEEVEQILMGLGIEAVPLCKIKGTNYLTAGRAKV